MDPFEVREVLETFRIIVDTREHRTPEAKRRLEAFGVPTETGTLSYGDYAANITLHGAPLHDISNTISPACVIERKMGLDEIAGNLTRGRDRFRREFERATENHARVFLLIENATYEGIINHRYMSRFNENAFLASLVAWQVRYNMTAVMCKSDTSGRLIKEILYRDMKERLEHGEYG